jgi:hypothetical protein
VVRFLFVLSGEQAANSTRIALAVNRISGTYLALPMPIGFFAEIPMNMQKLFLPHRQPRENFTHHA